MKTLITDLDGTLLTQGNIDEKTKEACLLWMKEDRLVLATGRNLTHVQRIVDELEMKSGALILLNGMVLYDLDDQEVLKEPPFQKKDVSLIVKLAHLCLFRVTLVTEYENVPLVSLYDCLFYFLRWLIKHKPIPELKKNKWVDDVMKIELGKTYFFRFFYPIFKLCLSKKYDIIRTSKYWIEIMPKGKNKANMVSYLMEKYHLSNDEVYIFGDGENDIEMLKKVKHSYSPITALDNVKDVASTIYEDSIAQQIIKILKES